MKPIRLITGILTVGFWTLASRFLGLARDILIATMIGPGPLMDAFVAAFRLPNMFRRFFAEGAFNAAFVPMYSKKVEAEEDPQKFARDAFNGLALVLLMLTGLALVFMPVLVWATAGGFAGDERFDLTIAFGRVTFPYILLISLAALFSGALNAMGRFAAAAAAPVLLNIFIVTALVLGPRYLGGDAIWWLIWCIPLGGVAQLVLVWIAAERAGLKIRPGRPRLTSDIKRLTRIAIPAALAGGVMQVNLLVGQQVASHFDKAVSWLFNADRLYQLPLGVVGIAIGIVLLPDLSRRLKAEDHAGGRMAFSRAGELSLALTVPCAVALVVIPYPLVSVLFEHGRTGPEDARAMSLAVAIYGLGLPAFVLQKVLQPLYFAREDTRSPFRYAVWSMAVNAVAAIGLAPVIGWIAPAIATTLAGWTMVLQLAFGARRMGDVARFDARFYSRLMRILAACAVMGAALYGGQVAMQPWLAQPVARVPALLALIALGSVVYGLAGQLLGAFSLSEIKSIVRRRSAS
ncbi:putative peptidoglycan lipid II flippase [Sagittula marina]|uniref:Probable lipid II flippase MurJ n=1 Tax=Sagittula marina TaxID=943940 RepID=A0A7W6DRM1_9RHOB|nr:murein biosynthesis integral membrane protein MurJ [Sagittula marina]MBB3986456.1 putative peptidoglycan lipid II flippase [Sagittula marina]